LVAVVATSLYQTYALACDYVKIRKNNKGGELDQSTLYAYMEIA
jgi:hypothetical protein